MLGMWVFSGGWGKVRANRNGGTRQMNRQSDEIIRYKWNPRTETGYRLRFDAQRARNGGLHCYRVEDWAQHKVVEEWGCNRLEQALDVLHDFFDIDVGREMHRIEDRIPRVPG